MGIFKEVQYINILAAILNIVLSVILGKILGVPGIIVATALSRLATSFWFEGKVVFNKFAKPVSIYYLQQLKDFVVCCVVVSGSMWVCGFIKIPGIIGIVIKLLIASTITLSIEFAVYYKTEEFSIMVRNIKGAFIKKV